MIKLPINSNVLEYGRRGHDPLLCKDTAGTSQAYRLYAEAQKRQSPLFKSSSYKVDMQKPLDGTISPVVGGHASAMPHVTAAG